MAIRICALLMGIVFLFFGVSGLIPGLVSLPPDRLGFYHVHIVGQWGFLFGWMPRNAIHDAVYILLGIGGVVSFASARSAAPYCRGLFAIMALFVFLGVMPWGVSSVGGLMPLFDWNVMFHTVAALIFFYFGWVYPMDGGGREPASELR